MAGLQHASSGSAGSGSALAPPAESRAPRPSVSAPSYVPPFDPNDPRPSILVLGGCGFIGRQFVKYVVDARLASYIRVADKALPQTSFFAEEHLLAFSHVEFIQSNLCQPAHVTRAFNLPAGRKFNYVFNLAAETRFGLDDQVYKQYIFDLAVACGAEAERRGVDRFIEVSTGQVYKPGSRPRNECQKLAPWTRLAHNKLQAEDALRSMPRLNLIIVRPAIVYGPGDMAGLAPRIICGAVYQSLQKKMKFLWSGSLKINTVHVHDVVRALWKLALSGRLGEIYNLADKQDTDQAHVSRLLKGIYTIKTDFVNTAMCYLAQMHMKDTVEAINEKHMEPWHRMCRSAGIVNTPLSPFIDQELLYNNSLALDGTKIERDTGFVYEVPLVTRERLIEQILYHVNQRIFPVVKIS